MLKVLLLSLTFLSVSAFSQGESESDPRSDVNTQEQVNGLPGSSEGSAYSVRTKKRILKIPNVVAPVENHSPANCADSLGGSGSANFTACEALKKTR